MRQQVFMFRPTSPSRDSGFTLVELLTVTAIIAALLAVLMPSFSQARLAAKVAKAKAELAGIDTALQMYRQTHQALPPARTYCEYGGGGKVDDWAELPLELAEGEYLPAAPSESKLSVNLRDPFNPEHTYKYLAPGPGFHNGGTTISWLSVPQTYQPGGPPHRPVYFDREDCPVQYALWSVGNYGDRGYWDSLMNDMPLEPNYWYPRHGGEGLIVRARLAEGRVVDSP